MAEKSGILLDMSALWLSVLFGALGAGYLVYGRREQNGVALLSGVGLVLAPYLLPNAVWILVVGAVLSVLPFVLRE